MATTRIANVRIDLDELRDYMRAVFEDSNEWRDYSPDEMAAMVAVYVAINYPRDTSGRRRFKR